MVVYLHYITSLFLASRYSEGIEYALDYKLAKFLFEQYCQIYTVGNNGAVIRFIIDFNIDD